MNTNLSIDAGTETPASEESAAGDVTADRYAADRYRDVALGVECAWPAVVLAD